MKKVKITAIRQTEYKDLMAKYENPIEHTCDVSEGQQWVSVDGQRPMVCALLLGIRCANLWSRWLGARATSMMVG